MSAKRQRQVFIGVVVVVTLCVAMVIYAVYQNNQKQAQLEALGALDTVRMVERPAPSGELVVEGTHFTIYESEIDVVIERNNLFYGVDGTTVKQAVLYLAELKSVYEVALNEGYGITDEELAAMIAANKAEQNESASYDDFLVYTAAMGITVDEYWELLLTDPDYRREIVVLRYLQDKQNVFYEKNGYTDGEAEAEEAWEDQMTLLTQNAMRQENMDIVSEREEYTGIELY